MLLADSYKFSFAFPCCSVTCVYLASKVEEFNVSISQFVANVKGDREKATDIILNNELLLMQRLHYHLTVHNPYRPVEGLLIDIKVSKHGTCSSFFEEKITSPMCYNSFAMLLFRLGAF